MTDEKTYWIQRYEQQGCIDLSQQEKDAHSAQEWREMYLALVEEQTRQGSGWRWCPVHAKYTRADIKRALVSFLMM